MKTLVDAQKLSAENVAQNKTKIYMDPRKIKGKRDSDPVNILLHKRRLQKQSKS
jgi:hypothetical protein